MEIVIDRKYKKANYTISNLTINGVWFCNTIEDTDRNLDNSMSPEYIKKVKDVNSDGKSDDAITAIPRGTYKVTLDIFSPSFGNREFYKNICNGKLPRLLNVPGFDGVLMHCGTGAPHSAGCLILGYNKIKGGLVNSKGAFESVYNELLKDKDNITIKIL